MKIPRVSYGLLLLMSCGQPPQPAAFRQTVRLGGGEFIVEQVESTAFESREEIAVHFRWTGRGDYLLVGGWAVPKLRMRVVDSSGTTRDPKRPRWSPIVPVPEEIYAILRNCETGGAPMLPSQATFRDMEAVVARIKQLEEETRLGHFPTAWVAVFEVKPGARGLSLVVTNPDRRKGEPKAVSIALNR